MEQRIAEVRFFTIYYNPLDYPGKYVVREFALDKPTHNFRVADTLTEAREHALKMGGRICFHRDLSDESQIVESWME